MEPNIASKKPFDVRMDSWAAAANPYGIVGPQLLRHQFDAQIGLASPQFTSKPYYLELSSPLSRGGKL